MSHFIKSLITQAATKARVLRQKLHKIPELAGEETKTSTLLRQALTPLPLTIYPPYLATDVVATLTGKSDQGKIVALRADIDALPIVPAGDNPDRLTCHHACGHDGHAAALWGAAQVLSNCRECFDGVVCFIFQPGEEVKALARDLVKAGVLDNPRPDYIFAQHCGAGLAVGAIKGRIGLTSAAAGFFSVELTGRGGHGCSPETSNNPISALSSLAVRLNNLASEVRHQEHIVSTVCQIKAGSNSNVIPAMGMLSGTFRYLCEEDGMALEAALRQIVVEIASQYQVQSKLEYVTPYPVMTNDATAIQILRSGLEKIDPEIIWVEKPQATMGSEDFPYYLQVVPGAYVTVGIGENCPSAHTPEFNFNDDALESAITVYVAAALSTLGAL